MGTPLQKVAWVLGSLIIGLVLGAVLHSAYVANQRYEQVSVEAAEAADRTEATQVFRAQRKARHGAEKALAEARLDSAIASAPAWADQPVPDNVRAVLEQGYETLPDPPTDDELAGLCVPTCEVGTASGLVGGLSAPGGDSPNKR